LDKKQKQLETLSAQSANLSVRLETLRRAQAAASGYRDLVSETQIFGFGLDDWPSSGGADLLQPVRSKLSKAEKFVEEAHALLTDAIGDIETAIRTVERERAPLEEQARVIRREVEGLKEGAGAAARQLA
ncbi:hypothetical protein QUS50_22485, partial [Xanthomonas citri pv. citri]